MTEQPVFAQEITGEQLQAIMQQVGGSTQLAPARPIAPRKPQGPLYVHIGFDTQKQVWFVNFFDFQGQTGGFSGTGVSIDGGCGEQYEWTDPNSMWHIRERMFWDEIQSVTTTGKELEIRTKKKACAEVNPPEKYLYLEYAYHLRGNNAPRGFVEFFDHEDTGIAPIARIDDRWIIVEDVRRRTVGIYPNIRLRIEAQDIGRLLVTKTCAIIMGKS